MEINNTRILVKGTLEHDDELNIDFIKTSRYCTLSIITPYFNSSEYIIESLLSIAKQKYSSNIIVEHILVNDCSTDNSKELVDKFIDSQNNLNTKIIYKHIDTPQNIGCGGARKYGIDNSSGDYLMFLDSDDTYINNDFIERAVQTIISENADIVEYGVKYLNFFKGKTIESKVSKKIIIQDNMEEAEILLFKNNYIKFHVWTKIISRSLASKFEYSKRRKWEDVDTIPIWVSLANKIVIMPSVEINYRTPENSIIRENPLKTRLGTVEAISRHFEKFKDNINILKAMYERSMIDYKSILKDKTNLDPIFNELSKYNTYMLSYLMPDKYKELTYNLDIEEQIQKNDFKE